MKLYDAIGPNPQIVRMFLAEKGVDIPREMVDVVKGENRRPPYNTEVNVLGEVPALLLDDGTPLCEVTAICEYIEERQPDPPLIGASPEQRAETRMWTRRIDLKIAEPMGDAFVSSAEMRKFFEGRKRLLPENASPVLKETVRLNLIWLDRQMSGQTYVCGDRFTLADILLYCFLKFGEQYGQPIPPGAAWLRGFYERVGARPSAAA